MLDRRREPDVFLRAEVLRAELWRRACVINRRLRQGRGAAQLRGQLRCRREPRGMQSSRLADQRSC